MNSVLPDLVVSLVFIGYAMVMLLSFGGLLTWVERKQSAVMADRVGANRAYIRWLKSGQASDPIGWRYSLKATATKQQLIALLNKLGARYGLRVPPATGLWP